MGLEYGMLAVRLGLGMAIAAHGAKKLFGWFGGHGLARAQSHCRRSAPEHYRAPGEAAL